MTPGASNGQWKRAELNSISQAISDSRLSGNVCSFFPPSLHWVPSVYGGSVPGAEGTGGNTRGLATYL